MCSLQVMQLCIPNYLHGRADGLSRGKEGGREGMDWQKIVNTNKIQGLEEVQGCLV